MDWSIGMRELQETRDRELNGAARKAVFEMQGLASWIMGQLRDLRSRREVNRKQLRLVETLPLGGKRQLMLVTCGGESFLVGGGMESVETIVRLNTNVSGDESEKSRGELCQ